MKTIADSRQTDDVGVFCSNLSDEYLLVAQAFGLNQRDLLALCSRGVETIFAGDDEKTRLRQAISEIGAEYGL